MVGGNKDMSIAMLRYYLIDRGVNNASMDADDLWRLWNPSRYYHLRRWKWVLISIES